MGKFLAKREDGEICEKAYVEIHKSIQPLSFEQATFIIEIVKYDIMKVFSKLSSEEVDSDN